MDSNQGASYPPNCSEDEISELSACYGNINYMSGPDFSQSQDFRARNMPFGYQSTIPIYSSGRQFGPNYNQVRSLPFSTEAGYNNPRFVNHMPNVFPQNYGGSQREYFGNKPFRTFHNRENAYAAIEQGFRNPNSYRASNWNPRDQNQVGNGSSQSQNRSIQISVARSTKPVTCYHCHEKGHIKPNCPTLKQRDSSQAQRSLN